MVLYIYIYIYMYICIYIYVYLRFFFIEAADAELLLVKQILAGQDDDLVVIEPDPINVAAVAKIESIIIPDDNSSDMANLEPVLPIVVPIVLPDASYAPHVTYEHVAYEHVTPNPVLTTMTAPSSMTSSSTITTITPSVAPVKVPTIIHEVIVIDDDDG